mmetsp:Transcript_21235/g.58916  ORF Transcript_21235/g.58916 Transcript_21235/m.58916 type:complete len:431 (+) Transcript_21235:244-1536(+)
MTQPKHVGRSAVDERCRAFSSESDLDLLQAGGDGRGIRAQAHIRTLGLSSPPLGGDLSKVNHTLAVAPLVVVPGNNLDHVITHDHGQSGVNGSALVHALEVSRHQGLIGHGQNVLHGASGSLTESIVHLLSEGLLLHLDNQIHNGDVGGGHTQGHTVQLALQVWQNQSHSLGCTSGGGHNVQGGSTSTAQIPVGSIQQALVTSVRVGGGHGTLDHAELLMQHLDEGSQAVGGARGVGDDWVFVLVAIAVHTDHEGGDVRALGGGGDQHLLGAGLDVLASAGGVNEHAGALNHQVYVHGLPGQLGGVTAGHHSDVLAVHADGLVIDGLHLGRELAQGGVVLQQVSGLLDTTGVVHAHDVQQGVLPALPAAQEVAANAAEAVDGHAQLLLGHDLHLHGAPGGGHALHVLQAGHVAGEGGLCHGSSHIELAKL